MNKGFCLECGRPFLSSQGNARCCSTECYLTRNARLARARYFRQRGEIELADSISADAEPLTGLEPVIRPDKHQSVARFDLPKRDKPKTRVKQKTPLTIRECIIIDNYYHTTYGEAQNKGLHTRKELNAIKKK